MEPGKIFSWDQLLRRTLHRHVYNQQNAVIEKLSGHKPIFTHPNKLKEAIPF